ncbi:hypothetical protein LNP25_31745 [Klebsiella variicola subsp. variicola]|nr:hypothetical protein [Klebsiella variicola subsp. variicola]
MRWWTQTGAGACLADAGCGDPRRRPNLRAFPRRTAMTGIDALTHAVRAYSASRHAVYRQSGDGGDSR